MFHIVISMLAIFSIPVLAPGAVLQTDLTRNDVLNIGVLAYRGHERTLSRWKPTARYLSQRMPYTFNIIPLTNDDIELSVEQGRVDFVLTNPASYAVLEAKYGVARLATLLNHSNGSAQVMFGAVIFTRRDRDDIQTIKDISGKRFMAVHPNAFGGWWMAKREFLIQGVNPLQDFAELMYVNFPQDQIVHAVRDGVVDAGTVRTNVLERMAEEGQINLDEFKVLNPQKSFVFHSQLSTRLYPEWPFSAARHVPVDVARQVTLALLSMPEYSVPARAARIKGWISPLDYQSVIELMRELRVGHFTDYGHINLNETVDSYRYWILGLFLVFLLLVTGVSYAFGLNRRYMAVNRNLEREIAVRKELEEQLKYEALHDALTRLPNRTLFLDRLHQEIYLSEREGKRFAIGIIDLDNFKTVNDQHGHGFGDKLLIEVADRFTVSIRRSDTIARFGGDEFALLIDHSLELSNATMLAEKIRASLQEPFRLRGIEFNLSASIGVAVYPDHGVTVDELMLHADIAMYRAKQNGKGVVIYNPEYDNEPQDLNERVLSASMES